MWQPCSDELVSAAEEAVVEAAAAAASSASSASSGLDGETSESTPLSTTASPPASNSTAMEKKEGDQMRESHRGPKSLEGRFPKNTDKSTKSQNNSQKLKRTNTTAEPGENSLMLLVVYVWNWLTQ